LTINDFKKGESVIMERLLKDRLSLHLKDGTIIIGKTIVTKKTSLFEFMSFLIDQKFIPIENKDGIHAVKLSDIEKLEWEKQI
jgi:hypothetical protein